MAKYNISQICCEASKSFREGVGKQVKLQEEELKTTKMEHGFTKRRLKVHEDREKRRIEGIKKAAAKKGPKIKKK